MSLFSRKHLLITWMVLLFAAPVVRAQDAGAIEEIRAAMASGDFRAAASRIDKQLFPAPKDPAVQYELLMLKGECRLQLKDRMGASTAFRAAVKPASGVEQFAAARANALIVERSNSGRYTPKFAGGSSEAIDIMAMADRKRAMTAYQEELSRQYQSQVESALRATQLPQIEKVFSKVADMYCLELFAKGEASQTDKMMRELGGHAYELMHNELVRCSTRVDYLAQVANSSGMDARGWDSGRMGLTSQQRDEVKEMLPYLNQIRQRASEYRGIAARLGGNEAKWDALVADSVAASADAESLYNDR